MALLPVDEAKARILKGAKALPSEMVPLRQALGRVLAKNVTAKRDQPPFPASAMDGYAVRHADIATVPATLKVIGMAPAGHGFRGKVKPGEAVRIFTGAPMPKGADTVVIQENTEASGSGVTVQQTAPDGANIRVAGVDFRRGEELLKAGTTVDARTLGLAAAMNCAELAVHRRPKVAIFATGDELVMPGKTPRADQIMSSNSFALSAFISRFGAEPVDLGIIPDRLPAIRRAIRKAEKADILLTTGGASVGDHDLVQQALAAEGIKLDFWKIALRPGKPLMYAKAGQRRILGLPGNPVSALVCSRIFLKPLLDLLLGRNPAETLKMARLTDPLPANDQRQDYLRARLSEDEDGQLRVTPMPKQDSSLQRALREAGALIVRAPFEGPAAAGDSVSVLLLDF
ncbi:MAG: gephyrin-like molybdotransferase Glp [Parvibaculaceae bacterium]